MARGDRICAACHSHYHYCPSCREDMGKPVFMYAFCSEECKDVFEIVSSYYSKHLTKDQARAALAKIKYSEKEFADDVKAGIAEIVGKTDKR